MKRHTRTDLEGPVFVGAHLLLNSRDLAPMTTFKPTERREAPTVVIVLFFLLLVFQREHIVYVLHLLINSIDGRCRSLLNDSQCSNLSLRLFLLLWKCWKQCSSWCRSSVNAHMCARKSVKIQAGRNKSGISKWNMPFRCLQGYLRHPRSDWKWAKPKRGSE